MATVCWAAVVVLGASGAAYRLGREDAMTNQPVQDIEQTGERRDRGEGRAEGRGDSPPTTR